MFFFTNHTLIWEGWGGQQSGFFFLGGPWLYPSLDSLALGLMLRGDLAEVAVSPEVSQGLSQVP